MSILLSIPTEVCHEMLAEWLQMTDWGRLDVAVSNKKMRPQMLEQFKLLYSPELEKTSTKIEMSEKTVYDDERLKNLINGPDISENHGTTWPLTYKWIHSRSIRLKHLNLLGHFFDKKSQLIFPVNFDSIVSLKLSRNASKFGLDIIHSCPNLRNLDVYTAEILLYVNRGVCTSLEKIKICSGKERSEALVIAYIKDNCRSLKSFIYNYCEDRFYVDLIDIMKRNSNLNQILLYGTNELLVDARQFGQNLRYIELYIPQASTSDLKKFFKGYRLPEYVKIQTGRRKSMEYNHKIKFLYVREFSDIDNSELVEFLSLFSNLRKVWFDGMWQQTDNCVSAILSHSATTLISFRVGLCGMLSDLMVKRILLECKIVQHLEMFHGKLRFQSVLDVFSDSYHPSLKSLSFQGGIEMNIVSVLFVLKSCPHLEKAVLAGVPCDYTATEEQVTELNSLTERLSECNIEWVDLDYYDRPNIFTQFG